MSSYVFTQRDDRFKVVRVPVGKGPGQTVSVFAFDAPGEAPAFGIPTVGLGNNLDDFLGLMTPDTADALGDALKLAANVARGKAKRPKARGA